MSPWNFGWDAIAALAGVVAVLVAAVLGWQGVRLARKALDRAKLDYIAERADVVADQLADLRRVMGRVDTALRPYWATKAADYAGNDPDYDSVHGVFRELEASCGSLELSVRGLALAVGGSTAEGMRDSILKSLSLLNTVTYISVVYFVNSSRPETPAQVRAYYERQLKSSQQHEREFIVACLESMGQDLKVPNAFTSINSSALSRCMKETEALVERAFKIAGS